MNVRLSLKEVKDYLVAQINDPSITIRTVYDADYLKVYGKSLPAIWIGGQRATNTGSEDPGYSGITRQHVSHELAIRLMIKRYGAPGDPVDIEEEMDSMFQAVTEALLKFQSARAGLPFIVSAVREGAPEESLITCDLIFKADVVYQATYP